MEVLEQLGWATLVYLHWHMAGHLTNLAGLGFQGLRHDDKRQQHVWMCTTPKTLSSPETEKQ